MAGAGLLALLDDVATLADDVATLTLAATKKTTGIVTDDLAVTAEQTMGIAADRELPMVWKVARGSLFNKTILLAPAALLLDAIAPWAIGPLLMAGGLFLCFEGAEKILHKVWPGDAHEDAHHEEPTTTDPVAYETQRVNGAIRTDLILSAEIVAITLGEVTQADFVTKAAVLYAVSIALTVGVYGLVAVLVRLDNVGAHLALQGGPPASLGRVVVRGTPALMRAIAWIGTLAMLAVGGHILVEGIPAVEHLVHDLVDPLPHALHGLADFLAGAIFGGLCGAAVVAVVATGVLTRLRTLLPGATPKP